MIEIVMRNDEVSYYKPEEYTDYKYDGKYFIVIYENQWIGLYNLDCIRSIKIQRFQRSKDNN